MILLVSNRIKLGNTKITWLNWGTPPTPPTQPTPCTPLETGNLTPLFYSLHWHMQSCRHYIILHDYNLSHASPTYQPWNKTQCWGSWSRTHRPNASRTPWGTNWRCPCCRLSRPRWRTAWRTRPPPPSPTLLQAMLVLGIFPEYNKNKKLRLTVYIV